jgi:nicotinate-nucleotide pyrophosphorylase (carboxylating)
MGMYDRVLMKDNHRRLWRGGDPDALDQAVEAARRKYPELEVEVEVESLEECASALKAKPEWIMLDNMSLADMKSACGCARGGRKPKLPAALRSSGRRRSRRRASPRFRSDASRIRRVP